jgi:hypothetical protein
MNVLIPIAAAGYVYPNTSNVDMVCLSLTIGEGALMQVRGGTTTSPKTLTVSQATIVKSDGILEFLSGNSTKQSAGVLNSIELKPSAVRAAGVMIINPYSKVTASGSTTISSPAQFQIKANASSVGSFIDNGTIVYNTGGSASVQTYIKNSAAPGSFYAHLVGPTVNDPAFQTAMGYTGVYLSAFDLVTLGTYAYEYLEPTNAWGNIAANTTPVKTAKGIMLSTVDALDHTMTMTGRLITGAVSSANLQHSGTNNLDLLSNPYPSSLDFSLFYTANSANISNKYQVYNPATGTYLFFITTGGGTLTKNIQAGQGFFVETLNSVPATFANSMRLHSTAALLKDEYPYQLRLNLTGNGFTDATFIQFNEEGTWDYDEMYDVYKWYSMVPEASEFWSIGNNNTLLSMNTLPVLGEGMVNVQVDFKCGADGVYQISAENIGSFASGTEIFLEDLQAEGAWINLVTNPVYEFFATPSGMQNRFIVHFFGPTGIEDPASASAVKIYGYGQEAYIVNRGNETIKNYIAYDMMGRELHSGTLPNNSVNRVWVSNVSGSYIMKVSTKEGRIYTDKVYITK